MNMYRYKPSSLILIISVIPLIIDITAFRHRIKRSIFQNIVKMENDIYVFLLVSYVEGGPWWPIQSPNRERKKERKKKANS